MKTCTVLVMALFALTSFPLLAQQSPSGSPSTSPGAQAASPSGAPSSPSASQQTSAGSETSAAVPTAPPVEMRPVKAELLSKLDTKTAKMGDDVVVQTKAAVKTAAGTEIPKGSKLLGHVIAVQPSAEGHTSQVALQFDRAELKGGESVPIHSEIQSIAPAGSAGGSAGEAGAPAAPSASPSGGSTASGGSGATGSAGASGAAGSAAANPGYTPGYAQEAAGASGESEGGPIVARNGKIAIHRTSVPGVLLANNAPGEQDPRMAQASGILLGAKDVQLESGTQMVLGVAATGAGSK